MVQEDPTLHLSHTGRMKHAFRYFLGFKMANEKLDWSDSKPEEWMKIMFDKHIGTSHTSHLWHKVIELIFSKLHIVFIPHKHYVVLALNAKLPEDRDEPKEKKHKLETFMVRVSDWAKESLKRCKQENSSFRITDLHPRWMQTPPDFIKTDVESMDSMYHMTLQGLSCSTYNWVMTPKNNNMENMRCRFAKSIMQGVKHHEYSRVPLLQEHPELFQTRVELLALIHQTPGLIHFPIWTTFVKPDGGGVDKMVYEDKLVQHNSRMQRHEELDAQFDKNFQTFTQRMAKKGVLGVPQLNEDGVVKSHGLHPALQEKFMELY